MTGKSEVAREVSVRELRKSLAGHLNEVAVRGEIVYVTNHGRRVAALVPVPLAESLDQGASDTTP